MLGIQLVTQLNVLVKTARIHGRTNAALDKPVNAMIELVKTLAAEQPIAVGTEGTDVRGSAAKRASARKRSAAQRTAARPLF